MEKGDLAIVVNNTSSHGFKKHELIRFIAKEDVSYVFETIDCEDYWYLTPNDFIPLDKVIKQLKTQKVNKVSKTTCNAADYLTVGNVTIAIPINTPVGISYKHPDDDFIPEIGQALALKRMLNYSRKKGDKFKIIGNGNWEDGTLVHHFDNGEIVTLIKHSDKMGGSLYKNKHQLEQYVEDYHVLPITNDCKEE